MLNNQAQQLRVCWEAGLTERRGEKLSPGAVTEAWDVEWKGL